MILALNILLYINAFVSLGEHLESVNVWFHMHRI